MHRFVSTGLLTVMTLLTAFMPVAAQALDNGSASCTTDLYKRLAYEERLYRSVLFGQKKSAELSENSVRYDTEFDTWIKTGPNQWKSLDVGNTGTTWSDMLMDDQADIKPRKALLGLRKTPTSDLLPPIIQSVRALQCRLKAACMASRLSLGAAENGTVKVRPEGCIQFEIPVSNGCRTVAVPDLVSNNCETAVVAIIERESRLLEMLVAYDAAYRSLMQFAGIFEGFLDDFRFPLLEPMWQMVRTMGAFDNISCFAGQCDD